MQYPKKLKLAVKINLLNTASYIGPEVIYLKNMVGWSCKKLIRLLLEDFQIEVLRIDLGEIVVKYAHLHELENAMACLNSHGFEPLQNREKQLVEQIKVAVIELIHFSNYNNSIIRNSDYLVEKLGYSYQHLAGVFKQHMKITLERFIIHHKIEKVKELIDYGELSVSEIAFQLGYSSVQYLSTQFKSTCGYSISDYRKGIEGKRIDLQEIGM